MSGIVIIGAAGQVGRELSATRWPDGLPVHPFDRRMLDVSKPSSIAAALDRLKPDFVINASAYTAVDKAESESALAYAINRDGPAYLAEACRRLGATLVHISTDYVFDGTKDSAYDEADPVAPLGVYGASKEAGEAAIRAALPHHVILRTAWVFGAHGGNFVKTMLRLGAERPELRVVADQRGCPTPAASIAAAIGAIVARLYRASDASRLHGTYHFAGAEPTSWHGFAEAIFEIGERHGQRRPRVHAIGTSEFPTPARRPANSVLSTTRISEAFGVPAADWRGELDILVGRLLQQSEAA